MKLQYLACDAPNNQHNSIMDTIYSSPVIKSFLAGSISGTCSTIMFQPLDLVKTRLQSSVQIAYGVSPGQPAGMITVISHILRKEHMLGLWKGMTPSITRCVPGVGLYFSSLHVLKTRYVPAGSEPGALQAVTLGIVARTMSGVCLIPITVIKTRFESGMYDYTSVLQALKTISRTEGARGLCCGLVPTLFRDAPFSGLYLMFYTQAKKLLPEDCSKGSLHAPVNFSCGLLAGVLASVVTQPADVLKTKMQLYPDKFGNLHSVIVYVHQVVDVTSYGLFSVCSVAIHSLPVSVGGVADVFCITVLALADKKYGVQGYFRGLVPRMLRRTLMAAMAWTVYEQITRSMGLK